MQLDEQSGEQPRDRPGRKWRRRLLAPGLLLALALALPVAAPLLVELLAPALGAAWGLTGLSVEIDRIGWRVVTVRRIAFESGRVALAADRGRIEYRFAELVRGRAQLLAFDRLALTVNPARPEGSDTAGPPAFSVDGAARWRDALPFERAEVRDLAVAVPAVGFRGGGVLRLEADALELSLVGEAPAAAAGFRVDLRADRGGNAVLRLDEGRPPAPSGAVASTPRVALEMTLAGGGLEIAGDVWLDGYAWDLVASVFDLPVGEGSTIGRFLIRVPGMDVGGADLRSLVATGQIQSLNWVSASGSPVVEVIDAELGFERDPLSAESGGAGWVAVRQAGVTSSGLEATAAGGRIEYQLAELLQGRVGSVAFDELALTMHSSGAQSSGSAEPAVPLPNPVEWRDALPLGRAEVRELTLAWPERGLLGRGRLSLDADALMVDLAGKAPAAATGLRLNLRGDRSGHAALKVSEHSHIREGSSGKPAPLLAIEVTPSEVGLDLEGEARLQGFLWDLASTLLDLPAGRGLLDAEFEVRLPWAAAGVPDLTALDGETRIRSLTWTAASGSPALTVDDGRLRFEGKRLEGDLAGTVRAGELAVPLATRLGVGDLHAQPVTVRGEILRGALEGLSWTAVFDPVTSMPSLAVKGDLRISDPFLKALLERWRGGWDLDSGSLALAAELRWPEIADANSGPPAGAARTSGAPAAANAPTGQETVSDAALPWPKGRVSIGIRDASAHYEDYVASGLTGVFTLDLDGSGWRLAPTELRAAKLSAGFELDELEFVLAGSSKALVVQGSSVQAFGGTLVVAPFDYDFAAGSTAFVVQLEGIDLARLLALYGERISGTGVLDGALPVTVAEGALSIRGGRVVARAPGGVIRLAPELTRATGQPGLDFGLAALSDFTYTQLAADVDYAPSGDLALGMSLQGRNPAVEGGRPIHYNLNVTENVPQLLESLTLHERLVRGIERHVTE